MLSVISIWVTLACWAARVAARKGYSFCGYLIVSLFLRPAALIAPYGLDERATVVQNRPAPTPA